MSFTENRKGKLIVFEGIDGAGKSTQIQLLKEKLEKLGKHVITSFEPTSGKWGSLLRASGSTGRYSLEEEAELFLKDRREHVDTLIVPALERGDWVLLDRYYISMMAYQGIRGMNIKQIRELNEKFAPVPDVVLWLDIPVKESLNRIGMRGLGVNSFEKEESLRQCRAIFESICEPWMVRIDADAVIDLVVQRIVRSLVEHGILPEE